MADVAKYRSEAKAFWQKTEELQNELQILQRDTQSIECPCTNPDCPFNSKNTARARADSGLYYGSANHRQQFLASSLPETSEDFKKRRSLRREGSLDADSLKVPAFTRRPRSASLHISNIRRSLRGLRRARPSSARSSRAKHHGDVRTLGKEVSTQEVDNAFARIKQQLVSICLEYKFICVVL